MGTIQLEAQQAQGGGGVQEFDDLNNRPKYAGEEMTHATDIPDMTESVIGVNGIIIEPII